MIRTKSLPEQIPGAILELYHKQMVEELHSILQYWMQHTIDATNGGFYGKVDNNNMADAHAPKGAVLNARILWTFSAAYNLTRQPGYLQVANRAYQYITEYFIDRKYGGTYWSVNYKGEPLETKKQVYAQAFLLYACSEYYLCTHNEAIKANAQKLYRQIEKHSFDRQYTGYFEAFTREWQPLADLRLSDKDANEKKSMNTHLHVLEAYSSLYKIWPTAELKRSITLLLHNFSEHIAGTNGHLHLFFDECWRVKDDIISYGHDIEAAWLMLEAAVAIGDNQLIDNCKFLAINIAQAVQAGLDADGGLWYEKQGDNLIKEKHWWPQAEAMVGFYNAWQIKGDTHYLNLSLRVWQFIQAYIKINTQDEWYWGIDDNGQPMQGKDKAGFWKCPYHNSRACMEIIKRIGINL
ncbi:MAG TPA: AGE family epimerase/isomerase [Ferruginibacter sp.]|nr:AGE family epimerase/isomerase [Ferruginibacter sp.]HMP20642.1 AGE family epimerase/isomerase [Ferruginibacter sp.]